MRIIFSHALLFCFLLSAMPTAMAYKVDRGGESGMEKNQKVSYRADCAFAESEAEQNINNVRARLRSGGDVWWDGNDAQYVVPNVEIEPVSSIFAGSVWLGGVDPQGNLKLACQDYRNPQNQDFWPGPLTPNLGTVEPDTCLNWDQFFRVEGENIRQHFNNFRNSCADQENFLNCTYTEDQIPIDVKGWPGRGNPFFRDIHGFDLPLTEQALAGYFDMSVITNGEADGIYNPLEGDFPIIEIRGCDLTLDQNIDRALPDEMLFWIYNDGGGQHTASNGDPIRMEVQVQAFAYESDDELNNMTFQRYKLINRAAEDIDSTFFAMWVDPDLGCPLDDYVGCDVERSFAYTYNADSDDEDCAVFQGGQVIQGYGSNIPIVGVDYFRGPLDEFGDEIGMSSFTYYNNAGATPPPPQGTEDPNLPIEWFRYLTGTWRDGTPFSFGGTGYNDPPTDPIDYAFTADPNVIGGWSMCEEGLASGDRRTIQASGPFLLRPGAVNELIVGVVWAPDFQYPCPGDFARILEADDIAQNLFDACFQLTNGPDAPDIDIIELDQELVLVLTNDQISNNFEEQYEEEDIRAPEGEGDLDTTYNFEGYIIYQLRYPDVEASQFDDRTLARPIAQVDVKNNITEVYNWQAEDDPFSDQNVFSPMLMVEGENEGIRTTFRVNRDVFAEGANQNLINHRQYYFSAIAYAHNSYRDFDPRLGEGQQRAYLQGRRNIQNYTAVPRPIVTRSLQAQYGDGPIVARLDGQGNQGNFLDIEGGDEVRASIADGTFDDLYGGRIPYQGGQGPLDVIVYNPYDVVDGTYQLFMTDNTPANNELSEADGATWYLVSESNDTVFAKSTLDFLNEQIIAEYGFSLSIANPGEPGSQEVINDQNGAVGIELEYSNPNGVQWFSAFSSGQFFPPYSDFIKTEAGQQDEFLDPNQALSNVGEGIFYPMYFADWRLNPAPGGEDHFISPAWWNLSGGGILRGNQEFALETINNVDIVFTSDKSKWSRCLVLETANGAYYNSNPSGMDLETIGEGPGGCNNIQNLDIRPSPSVTREDNNGDGRPDEDPNETRPGFGWFPGYAVDVETGKRLNILFGENSTYTREALAGGLADDFQLNEQELNRLDRGGDMMWNPSSDFTISPFLPTPAGFFAFDTTNTVSDRLNVFRNYGNVDVPFYEAFLGGQHYIYVTKDEYDECESYYGSLEGCQPSAITKVPALAGISWTCIPLVSPGSQLLSYQEGLIPNDLVVKLRVNNNFDVAEGTGINNGYPAYEISFNGVAADIVDSGPEYDEALDAINIVPNPYYGRSYYESDQNTPVIKFTNLPAQCEVNIYSLDGRFIRNYQRNEERIVQTENRSNPGVTATQITPALEWDLRNQRGIPVASGVYLIHVDAGELGERVLKFFSVARQFDPTGL